MNKSFWGILFFCITTILSGCCSANWNDGSIGPTYTYIYEKHLQYDNPNEHFIKVTYSNSSVIETPNSNITLWNLSLVNPQTTIYLESNIKKDTLIYTLTTSKIYYESSSFCSSKNQYQIDIKGPTIIYSTFDSIVKTTKTILTGYVHDDQEIYRLK